MSVQGIQNHAAHQLPQEMRGIQKQEPVAAPVSQNDNDKPSELYRKPAYDQYIPGERHDAAPAKSEPERKAEMCTANTDKVDREIEKLKEKRDYLEQQIRTTKDPDKAADLKRQLAQLENELRQKDNDAYRRQNAVIL